MKPSSGIFKPLSRIAPVAAIMLALGLCCAGCLALAVPEVAYEGYKYEHHKSAKAAPTATPSSPRRHRPQVNDESVE